MTASERECQLADAVKGPFLLAASALLDGVRRTVADVARILRIVRRAAGETVPAAPGSPTEAVDRALRRLREDASEERLIRSAPMVMASPTTPAWKGAIFAARTATTAMFRGHPPDPDPSATLRSLEARRVSGMTIVTMSSPKVETPKPVPIPPDPKPTPPASTSRSRSQRATPAR